MSPALYPLLVWLSGHPALKPSTELSGKGVAALAAYSEVAAVRQRTGTALARDVAAGRIDAVSQVLRRSTETGRAHVRRDADTQTLQCTHRPMMATMHGTRGPHLIIDRA